MKMILVEEVYGLRGMASVLIPEDAPLEEVITRFAREPGISGVFLVDWRQRFQWIITRLDLLKWARPAALGIASCPEFDVTK